MQRTLRAPLPRFAAVALGLTALLTTGCISAPDGTPDEQRQFIDDSSDETIAMIVKDKKVTQQDIQDAAGYATISNVSTQVLLIGGDDGYGVLVDNSTGQRTYLDVNSIDMGPGIGIAKYRTLLVFESQERLDEFKDGQWEFGAGVSAVAKTADGAGGAAEDTASFDKDVDVYITGEKGLAVSATIRNMEIKVNKKLTQN